jgi:hypothetical protein
MIGFMLARDLVVEGVVDSSWREVRPVRNGSPIRATIYRIQVKHTLVGTAEDSTLDIASLGGDPQVQHGFRIIGYGDRNSDDGFRLWGGIEVIAWGPWPVEHEMLDSLRARSVESGFPAFERAAGVAIVRLGSFTRIDSTHYSYTCDSLGWAIPTDARVPSRIEFAPPPECAPWTGPGVTLIVPIPKSFALETLTAEGCTSSWRVVDGLVSGFGVPPNELNRALALKSGTLTIRPRLLPR